MGLSDEFLNKRAFPEEMHNTVRLNQIRVFSLVTNAQSQLNKV
ncbi:hypothetical protein NIES37_53980 [Tolypothrix tenuis PCC 7101]|uniref:Uncharacterized protein n=1 Tax=Tolypothrix tenuis PCC 7101 TaxID=231146 RepID=A0A1Z4N6Q4_9CYAN|nr:hypothetical protein NIES37_53980 [Tolypothrix tenuis PCC 7101]BAZ74679.1 hypothetical protein NIES50_32570 [Aulosira laxa NIES-50]